MEEKIIIAGFGGQGVLSLGQFIAYAAIADGKEVTWLPSYGPEMRGGVANCSVVVSDKPVASPIIPRPDCLIAMNKPSLYKFIDKVKSDGTVIINSSLISEKVDRADIKAFYIDAGKIAEDAGNPRAANLAAFGAYLKARGVFTLESAMEVVREKFKEKPKSFPSNLKALELGYNYTSQ
jgi:2-oxoacid:acceptor oxidoreductase, gamma subunit, pyruvate/2-ketoisovalerate family